MPDNKEEYVLLKAFDEFAKRMEDEDHRQNKRLEGIEEHLKETNKIAVSVEKLAINMEYMLKEQQNQSEQMKDQSERLKAIEDRDGEKWRSVKMYVITSVIGLVLGYLACVFGLK